MSQTRKKPSEQREGRPAGPGCPRRRIASRTKARPAGFHAGSALAAACLGLALILAAGFAPPALAAREPYHPAEERLVLPDCPVSEDGRLEICYGNGRLYVLSVGNGLLYRLDDGGPPVRVELALPDEARQDEASLWAGGGLVYVKPKHGNLLWLYDRDGAFIRRIRLRRKQEYDDTYLDLAADPRGNIYAVLEGAAAVEVFGPGGDYLATLAKLGKRAENLHGPPLAVFVDGEGYIHVAVRLPDGAGEIVRHTYQGVPDARIAGGADRTFQSLAVDGLGNVFALDARRGQVIKFDRRTWRVCAFSAGSSASLAVDGRGRVYLDSGRGGALDVLLPSDAAVLLDRGNRALLDGDLLSAERRFAGALALDNQMTAARLALGEIHYLQRRWFQALAEFELAGDRSGYSQALYGMRREILIEHRPAALAALLLAAAACAAGIVLLARGRRAGRAGGRSYFGVIWAPGAALDEAARHAKPAKALAFLVLAAGVNYLSWYWSNPLFVGEEQVLSARLFLLRLGVVLFLALLWSWTAFKVGELFQGMAGGTASLLTGTAVCLVPLIAGRPLLCVLSHLLTYQELWIHQWLQRLLLAWVGLLCLHFYRRVQQFTLARAAGVGLVSLGSAALILAFLGFLLGLNQQLLSFLSEVSRELINRLTT